MKQDSSFTNIKNMQKQNRLFMLVHLINSRAEGRQPVNIVLIIISALANIINFLSLRQIGVLKQHIFVLNHIFNLIFLPLLGLIVLQLIVGFFYQLEFFIAIQWKVYRFVVYPFVVSYLLEQSISGSFFNPTLAIVFFVIVLALSLGLTAIFSTESYVYKKLLHRDLPINFYLLVVETLFYFSAIIQNKNIEITAALLITILSYNIYNSNFLVMKENSLEFRLLCVDTFILLWCGMVFTVALFTQAQNVVSLIVASIPCMCYKICSDFTRQRSPVPYCAFISIFDDPDTIHFQQFIDSLQPIIQEIIEYYYSQNKKDFMETLLISYYYEHSNRSLHVNCPFKNEDYKYELKNMNDSKNMKEVLLKICKKIDYIYYGMYKTWPQHIDLKLSLVQFYIFCFPNKIRAIQIISEIQLSKLTLQQQYELFRVKILCQNMNSIEVAGEIKFDQRLVQFENLVYLTLNTMMEFWSLFYEEKIDFNKLTSITTKIFPLRKKIEEIFQDQLSQQTFSTLQILKLYSMYCSAIETNQEKSWKINDYLDKLRSRLEQHKQIDYLSFDSEIGLIALSLSENKLGNITIVNNQASAIFNYSKKDFKNIRVNEIMPKTFAQQHDNYLKMFLQNRTKKINSDQRRLFGKNKAGYIFPILLQLQRTVSSTGDQLLFIANIKKLKKRQASITCVTDQQGEICDYSSTFDYLFFKQERKANKSVQKNIQEFIPEFFDPNFEEDENTHCKSFKQMLTIKNYGKVQIEYIVSPVVFPLKQNGGYIVQGQVINSDRPLFFPQLSMTQSLRTMMNQQILSAHKTFYNPQLNRYQLSKQQQPINMNNQFDKQFTIPFININDVTDIFGIKKEMPVYGQHIKTIRLMKDHFQRVQDQSEFMSEIQNEKTQSAQTINQIMELKQSIMKQKKPTFMRNIKLGLLILSIGCVLIFIMLISQYKNYYNMNIGRVQEIKYKFKTRGYLSEYIIYFTALKEGFSQQQYQGYLVDTREDLINAIEKSTILETRKQSILKVAYLQNEANLTAILNQISQEFTFDEINPFNPIIKSWLAFFVILIILIIVTALNYCLFMKQLESVYQVFMCLQEKIIKKLHLECKKMIKLIQNSTQKERQDGNANHNGENAKAHEIKSTEDNEEENENPVKKIRKFKDNQKFRNLILLIKLVIPFSFIILVSMFNLIELYNQDVHIQYESSIHKEIYEIIPETSVQLMNSLVKNTKEYEVTNSENYISTYQKIDKVLFQYEQKFASHITENYFDMLMNNVCNHGIFTTQKSTFCKSLNEGTLSVGLSKALNYLANSLVKLDKTSQAGTLSQKFNDLIILEYQFIFPIVQHMTQIIDDELKRQFNGFANKYSTIAIIMIILIGINYLYFLRYPAYEIEEKIQLSKGLIDLLPEYYKNEKRPNREGYLEVKEIE